MKYLTKSILIVSLLLGGTAFADEGDEKGLSTLCAIFKNGQLAHKGSCAYDHSWASGTGEGVAERIFTVKGYGKFSVGEKWWTDYNKGKDMQTYRLNSKQATHHYRDLNSLAKISEAKYRQLQESGAEPDAFECVQNPTNKQEFCYMRDFR